MKLFSDKLIYIIFFVALLIRLPMYHAEFWRSPDAIEYLNVAQNIAEGRGLTSNIKWHYFDSFPITTSAYTGRPIITSLVFVPILKLFSSPYSVQLFLYFLGSLNAVLSYFLFRKYFSRSISFLGSLLFALNPNTLIVNRMLISEPVFTTVVLAGFICFTYIKDSIKKSIILGIITAIAFLTRIEGLGLLIVFLLFYIKKPRYLLSIIVAFALGIFPYYYSEFRTIHLFFYSYNSFHLRVFQFAEGMWEGFGRTFPPMNMFIKDNFFLIIKRIFNLTIANITTIFTLGSIGILSILYLFINTNSLKKFWPYTLFSLLVILFPSVVWSMFSEPERHYSTIFPFLIMPVLAVAANAKKIKKLAILVFLMTFILYIGLDIHRIVWVNGAEIQTDVWNFQHRGKIFTWINENTNKNSNIAAPSPWLMYLYTNRPSALLPTNLDKNNLLTKYIKTYDINYFVVENKAYAEFFKTKLKLAYSDQDTWIYSTKE